MKRKLKQFFKRITAFITVFVMVLMIFPVSRVSAVSDHVEKTALL